MTATIKKREVQIICPICKTEKQLNIPETLLNQAKPLTTISIQKGLLCNHHFQAFIDKNFKVRGYQKIDFEVKPKSPKDKMNKANRTLISKTNEKELFDNLIIEGNYVEYTPTKLNPKYCNQNGERNESFKIGEEMTLEEIYELFWDFIDDNNSEFRELIIKDKKRRSNLAKKALNLIEH